MPKNLLNSVNEILKRVSIISGDAGSLTSLSDSSRQVAIDNAIQVINEGIDELYSVSNISKPNQQAESTITLVAGTRSYALASDLTQLMFPMIDKSNNQYIERYAGGYNQMIVDDPEQDDTGIPHRGAINPVDGTLFLDTAPTAEDAGNVYTYQYKKDLSLEDAADTVPFEDNVFRAMVPAWVQLWKRDRRKEFDTSLYRASMGRASRFLRKIPMRDSYNPRRGGSSGGGVDCG